MYVYILGPGITCSLHLLYSEFEKILCVKINFVTVQSGLKYIL